MFVAIHYDSKLTGSKELRMDNSTNVFDRLKGEILTSIGDYVYAYDSKGKHNEPMFDGFLAGISLLSNDVFNEHFMYVPTEYYDVCRPNKYTSGLSTQYTDDIPINRSELPIDYMTSHHIFLLGPMNQTAVDYIMTIKGNVIFHVQGDASSSFRKTTTYPDEMTEHNTIFPCSFNFWTGETEMRHIRSKMTHTFTVKCKPIIDCNYVSVIQNNNPHTIFIPRIFLELREFMIQTILLGKKYDLSFSKLNIDAIFQDMIDKDNLVSCSMLLGNSLNIPFLSLIGRRVYSARPIPLSSLSFGEFMDGLNGDLQYPAIKTNEFPNEVFDPIETLKNHFKAVKGFMDLLPFEFTYNSISDKDIVDGMDETSHSERAPFFEPMIIKVGFMV